MNLLAQLTWGPDPELFSIGAVTVRWYGLLFAAGFLMSFWLVRRIFAREGRPLEDVETLLVTTMIGTIVGARLMHCFAYEPERYLSDPLQIVKVWEGGLASHGGVIGIVVALWIHSRRRDDQPFLWLVDRVSIAAVLAGAFVRVGNFVNSEIVGTPTERPWGVIFERRQPDALLGIARHPAQLYEALVYAATFVVLMLIYRRRGGDTPRGLLVGILLVIAFGGRFLIEFVKERQAEFGEDAALSMGQWLSIPVVLLGVWLIWCARGSKPTA